MSSLPKSRLSAWSLTATGLLCLGLTENANMGIVSAFTQPLQQQSYSRQHNNAPLCMVSKKEKSRLQEGAKKRQALEGMQIVRAQKKLAIQLRDFGTSKKSKAHDIKKLLRNAQHDGLNDIGIEARLLAMQLLYKAGRAVDVTDLLRTAESDSKQLLPFGLWAYAHQEDWNSAVRYAKELFEGSKAIASTAVFEENQLQKWAIQSFVNTNQNVEIATGLLLESSKAGYSVTTSANTLLASHVENGRFPEAKSLYETLQRRGEVLSKESHILALQCAAKEGDIELMEQVLGKIPVENDTTIMAKIVESLATSVARGTKLSPKYQALVV